MAKDKTQPRAALNARREAERQAQEAAARKRRRRLALNWLIGILIIGLVVGFVAYVMSYLDAQKREVAITGPANVEPVSPPNSTEQGMAILANPGVTLKADAPMVDVYLDFQASMSTQVMQFYGAALNNLASNGEIGLRLRFLTSRDAALSNTASSRGAIAAACADTVGKFMPYTLALFNATPFSPATGDLVFGNDTLLKTVPATVGMTGDTLTKFQTCYTNRATAPYIQVMSTSNQTAAVPGNSTYPHGVSSTPVMLANYKSVDIQGDLYAQTATTADETALLTLIIDAAAVTTTEG